MIMETQTNDQPLAALQHEEKEPAQQPPRAKKDTDPEKFNFDISKLLDFSVLKNAIEFLAKQQEASNAMMMALTDCGFGVYADNDPRNPLQRIKQLEEWRGTQD